MKIGGMYVLYDKELSKENVFWRPIFLVARPSLDMEHEGDEIEDREIGEIRLDEPFVLLEYRVFAHKSTRIYGKKNAELITVRILTKDGIVGWIDVELFMIHPYDEVSTR